MTAAKKTETNPFEAMAFNQGAFKEGYEKLTEGMTTMTDFQKSSMEAVMASAGAFAKGVEKIASENGAFLKAAMEESVSTAKAASSSKNIQEAMDLNTDFVQDSIEKNLSQINKVADLWVETTKETVEPLTERYSELVEKIQSYRP
ncbi:MAG: phasin family protein [Pseudomonadota bacterium]